MKIFSSLTYYYDEKKNPLNFKLIIFLKITFDKVPELRGPPQNFSKID